MTEHVAPRRVHVARLSHHLEIRLGFEQHPQTAADDRMVVGQHDRDGPVFH